jgi:xylulose-5-phosphate/fructose-6-phosphate phosphoketolase
MTAILGSEPDLAATHLSDADLAALDVWWRAANYLTVGQIYLMGNPLLQGGLRPEDVKPRLLGHWGTSPGLNLLWAHLNRAIVTRDVNMMFITGPGHGGPAIVANTWLERTYSELYPAVSRDAAGMARLFRQFSFPGGIPSHVAAEVPGSIHEGGELGYSLMHAYGAAFDNPDLIVACVVGDGEAETGPLAASWLSNVFLEPHHRRCRAADPASATGTRSPTRRCWPGSRHRSDVDAARLRLRTRSVVAARGTTRRSAPRAGARAIDWASTRSRPSRSTRASARRKPAAVADDSCCVPPKAGPGRRWERAASHQVPLTDAKEDPVRWRRGCAPTGRRRLFPRGRTDRDGSDRLAPRGDKRMSASPHANGGILLRDLVLPDIDDYAVQVPSPGAAYAEATRQAGTWLRELMRANPDRFRLFAPDEAKSNRLDAVLEATDRVFTADIVPGDDHLGRPAG